MLKVKLRHILLDRGMTLQTCADVCGLSYPTVQNFSAMSRGGVRWKTLEALCRGLNVQPGDLIVRVTDE